MAGRPQTRPHLLGLPFPDHGIGFAGKATGKSRPRRPQRPPRSTWYHGHPGGAPASQGLTSEATHGTVLGWPDERPPDPGLSPRPHAVHRDLCTAAATLD
jgi:hypothetical protein